MTIKLLKRNCLKLMQDIPTNSVDMILCDPPYGSIKGMKLNGWTKHSNDWDIALPLDKLFKHYKRILRDKGVLILFSEEPLTSQIRVNGQSTIMDFSYPLVWIKNSFGNPLFAKKAPVHFFEDISVFHKKYDNDLSSPLRKYADQVKKFIGKTTTEVCNDFGNRRIDHFFRVHSMEFSLPTCDTYDKLTRLYGLKAMPNYLTYDKMLNIQNRLKSYAVFNTYGHHVSDVFKCAKEVKRYHPTQKPVELLKKLVDVYTNPGDLVLDNCMGSGSTGVACKLLDRDFIGMELDNHYYHVAKNRIKNTKVGAPV